MPDPRVEDGLELRLDSLLLCQSEVLVLDRVGLACDGVKGLGEGNNLFKLVNRVDTLGDGTGVLGSGGVEDAFDALRVSG